MSIPPYTSYSLLAQLRFHGPLLWQLPRYILRAFAPLSLNCTLCVKPLFWLYPTLLTMCPYLTSWIWSGKDYLMMLLVVGRLSYLKLFVTNISEFSVLSRNASTSPSSTHSPPLSNVHSTPFPPSLRVQQPIHHFHSQLRTLLLCTEK